MKKIIIAVVVLGLIGAGIGFYMYNKPVQSLEKKKPDVMVSAEQILADYETDEKTADGKYLGKVVEVSGKISEITTEGDINKIHFETSNPIALVICELEKGHDSGGLNVGDQAKIKGLCSGYLSDVHLEQSTVVK